MAYVACSALSTCSRVDRRQDLCGHVWNGVACELRVLVVLTA